MHFACKFAKQVHYSPTWSNLCLFRVVPKLGWGWQECCVKFHYWRPWTWKWGRVGVAKWLRKTSYSPLIFECRKFRNLPFWQTQKEGPFRAFHFPPTRGGSITGSENPFQSLGWFPQIWYLISDCGIWKKPSSPLSKSSPPRKHSNSWGGCWEITALILKIEGALKVHSDSSSNSISWPLKKTPAFRKLFLSQGDLRSGIKFQPVFNKDEVASKKRYLGNLGPLWSSWWLAWPSHLRPYWVFVRGVVKALDDCLKLWEGSCGRNLIVMSKAG